MEVRKARHPVHCAVYRGINVGRSKGERMSIELSAGWWLTTHGGVELLRWSNDSEMYIADDGLGWFASSGQGLGNRIGTTLASKLEMPACIVQGTATGYTIVVSLPDAKRLTHDMREAWAQEVLRTGLQMYRQEQEQC